MKKKTCIISIILISLFFVFISTSFAMENSTMAQGVRNFMGDAENTMENAGNGIVSGIRNVTSGTENMMQNTASGMGYTAERTATEANNTFLGMDPTMFTWFIMIVVGIAIVALVWTYARQNDNSYSE